MTLDLLNTWIELQDIDCPPHLRVKRLIDRLGRRTTRCITPDEQHEIFEEHPDDVERHINRKNHKFTAEMQEGSIQDRSVVGKFFEIFGAEFVPWGEGLPSTNEYVSPSDDIAPYMVNLFGSELKGGSIANKEVARQLWNYYGEDKNESDEWDSIPESTRLKILLWAKKNRPEGLDPDNPEPTLDEAHDALQDSVATMGFKDITEFVLEYESSRVGGTSFYQSSIRSSLENWRGNSIWSRQAQVFHEAVSYLFSGRKDRFFKEYIELSKKKWDEDGIRTPPFNPEEGYSSGAFSDETLEYQSKSVEALISKERELWKSLIGDKPIRVYRGVGIYDEEKVPEIGATQAHDLPLSSWSISPSMAAGFGGIVLARTITADDIISSFFSMAGNDKRKEIEDGRSKPFPFRQGGLLEGEVILYTPEEGIDVDVISTWTGKYNR